MLKFQHYCLNITLGLLSALPFTATQAATLDGNFNNDSVAAQFATQPFARPEVSVFGGFYYHQDDGQMLEGGFYLSDPIDNQQDYRPWARVGLKALTFKADERIDDRTGSAIAPGVTLTFFIPPVESLYVDLIGFFAPDVLTSGDADGYWEGSARLTYELMGTADVYVGYRHIEFSQENRRRDIVLDDSLNVGAVFRF